MFEELVETFNILGKRFSEFYTNAGMVIEIKEYREEPNQDNLKRFYKNEGYSNKELTDIIPTIATESKLKEEFLKFYNFSHIKYSFDEIYSVVSALCKSTVGSIWLVQTVDDVDFYIISVVASNSTKQYVIDFYQQFD